MECREIFRVVAKWLDNNGYKILWQSLENWLTGYQKANFHFEPSSTVGQTVACVGVNPSIVYSKSHFKFVTFTLHAFR